MGDFILDVEVGISAHSKIVDFDAPKSSLSIQSPLQDLWRCLVKKKSQNKQDWRWMGQSTCLQVSVLCFRILKSLKS